MRNKSINRITIGIVLLLTVLCMSCSTTRKLAKDETLYVGVKKINVELPRKTKLYPSQLSAIKNPVEVAPNNPLFAPYVRSPFPIGLWVYNWNIKKEKGFKWWLYRKLSKKPVLLRDVQPDLRCRMVENVVNDYGIFESSCSYTTKYKGRKQKKAKLSYNIVLTKPIVLENVTTKGWPSLMDSIVQASLAKSTIQRGQRYNIFNMMEERNNITNALQDMGYYYFQPDFIEYMTDTVQMPGNAMVEVRVKNGVPKEAFTRCVIGDVKVYLHDTRMDIANDSTMLEGVMIYHRKPEILKQFIVMRAIKMRPNDYYNATLQQQTLSDFIQLGMFTYQNIQISPRDSVTLDTLNVRIDANYALPKQIQVELDVSSKSNNLLGPQLALTLSNRNIFKRAEKFSMSFTGSYEWQVGGTRNNQSNGLLNSFELGFNMNLSVPRMIGPKFIQSQRYRTENTDFQIGVDLLNRHTFFRLLSFWGSTTYEYKFNRHQSHKIIPFKLLYSYMLRTTEKFDSIINTNPAIAQSFKDQFVPSMSYTYTYDRPVTQKQPNRLYWQGSIMQAGNIISSIDWLVGKKETGRRIFGNIYSQFIKGTSDLIGYKSINSKNVVATRFFAGAGYPYYNTKVLPYSEQFYIGGANSIRAFQIRTIGPGSYKPDDDNSTSYLDQTGEMKLEFSIEYRYQIYNKLYGALFVDAGNIWLLRYDKLRPGGLIQWDTFLGDIALGTGTGLRYDLTYIVLRLDLGVPIHAPYDTGISRYYNIPKFFKGLVLNIAIGYPF